MHTAVLVALAVLLIAASIVARFLPARATNEESEPAPLEAVPAGITAVDVIGTTDAVDLAEAVELT